MYLLPQPKQINYTNGHFMLSPGTPLVLDYSCDFDDLHAITSLQDEIKSIIHLTLPIKKSMHTDSLSHCIILSRESGLATEAYTLTITASQILIKASTGAGVFYGVQTLRQIIRQSGTCLPTLEIFDQPYFANRGFYHDVTRGKVATLDTLKELIDRAAFYKLNQIQLYVEHSFVFEGLSEVWFDKDPLTAEEILYLDRYCKERHIDLVPSLSTFGHFYEILKSKSFKHLCELEINDNTPFSFFDRMAHHTLNTLEEGSFELVAKMLDEFIPLFSSNHFNICCDETFDLGKGKSKFKADEVGAGRLYVDFLNKIIDHVKKYDKKVMFWGDVILHHPELLSDIPEDVTCLTWDYSSACVDTHVKTIADTGRAHYVCPGVAGWNMLMNLIGHGFENIRRMTMFGKEHGAIGVLNTDWGDYGHINHFGSSMPGMIYGAHLSWNPATDQTDFTPIYEAISSLEYGDATLSIVSLLSEVGDSQSGSWGELIRWKEVGHHQFTEEEILSRLTVDKIVASHNIAVNVSQKLMTLTPHIRYNTNDFREFMVGTKSIALVTDLLLTILNDRLPSSNATPFTNPKVLATELELWFVEFSAVWRVRNKESELFRIRDIIVYMAAYLRDLAI